MNKTRSSSVEEIKPLTKLLRRLWFHIPIKRRKQMFLVLILMVFASFAEVFAIGAVLPFLAVLTTPETVFEHSYLQPYI